MSTGSRVREIVTELDRVRSRTLRLLERVPQDCWNERVHDFYSPIGWHFGHIGMTEEYWTCVRATGASPRDERLSFLYANIPENPKANRVHVPSRAEAVAYLAATRRDSHAALEQADLGSADPLLADGYAWEFALQHECQHQETIAELLQLIQQHSLHRAGLAAAHHAWVSEGQAAEGHTAKEFIPSPASGPVPQEIMPSPTEMVPIPGGTFIMGSDDPHGYDNEKRVHRVEVAPFALDAWPVSVAYWREFIADGGYSRRDLWSPAGWEWRKEYDVCRPEYWLQLGDTTLYCSAGGPRALHTDEPASAISWFEADAYARWAGKRLPTEAEWEFAAAFDPSLGRTRRYPWGDACDVEGVDCEVRSWHPSLLDAEAPPSAFGVRGMAGGVWEWTASPFLPYPGFEPFPYDGYSKEHMDGLHLVCRGGSWATDRRILRSSFRNWYVPGYRQGFLGMRCAR